jgi:N-acetylmuramoyl-L-alanine amidase
LKPFALKSIGVPANVHGTEVDVIRAWGRLVLCICVGIVSGLLPARAAASGAIEAQRIGGDLCVAVNDVARYYSLGSDNSRNSRRAEYKTSTAQLAVEADHRDCVINGVVHWLNAPALSARGKLWVSQVDVLKTIDPVLRQGKIKAATAVRTIVLDPGHGGSDRGASGRTRRPEKEFTLDLAHRVKADLADANVRVLLTRTRDTTTPLEGRVECADKNDADLFVSIHFNSGGSAEGIETYCVPPKGSPSTANASATSSDWERAAGNRNDLQNIWLAHCVQKSLVRATGAVDRGVRRARFYVLRNVSCPAILIEAGFLSNAAEEQNILRSEYRAALAKAIAEGILAYKRSVGTQ